MSELLMRTAVTGTCGPGAWCCPCHIARQGECGGCCAPHEESLVASRSQAARWARWLAED